MLQIFSVVPTNFQFYITLHANFSSLLTVFVVEAGSFFLCKTRYHGYVSTSLWHVARLQFSVPQSLRTRVETPSKCNTLKIITQYNYNQPYLGSWTLLASNTTISPLDLGICMRNHSIFREDLHINIIWAILDIKSTLPHLPIHTWMQKT